jgi:hypothetical protein
MPSTKPMGIGEAIGGLLARSGLQACRPRGLKVTLNDQGSIMRVNGWKYSYARLTVADVIAEDWWIEPIPADLEQKHRAA